MKSIVMLVWVCVFGLGYSTDIQSKYETQELISVFPDSNLKPFVDITFDKTANFGKINRLAIVSATATYEPVEVGIDRKESDIETEIEVFERNFINFGFTIVERMKVNKVLEELSLSMTGLVKEDTAIEAGKMLSAQAVCFLDLYASTIIPDHSYIKYSFKIISVETGNILARGIAYNTANGIAKLFEKFSDDYSLNWGMQCNQIGYDYSIKDKIDSSLFQYNLSLKILESIKYKNPESQKWVGIVYNNMGALYKQDKQWSNAYEWLNKSIEFNKAIDKNNPVLANTYRHLCELYLENKDYKNSEKYGQKGLEICLINNDLKQECKILKLMLKSYEENKDTNGCESITRRMNEIFCK